MKRSIVVLGLFGAAILVTQSCEYYGSCPDDQVKCTDKECHECCEDSDCGYNEFCNEDLVCEEHSLCGNCPSGWTCCNDGECHECCIDDDCLDHPDMSDCSEDYIICDDDYECYCVCYKDGENCSRDPGACCDGRTCDLFTNTCMPECTSDADCRSRTEIPYHEDLKCKNGVCDFDNCGKDADCPGGKVCFDGVCVTIPDCFQLEECVVLPNNAVTRQNTTAQFTATAYLRSGGVAPGFVFTWSSSNGSVAAVDDTGLVTGGAGTGSATITAAVTGCETVTCTAAVINYGVPTNTRVLVVDELTFQPVQSATVVVGAEAPQTTDANGAAEFAVDLNAGNPADVTVSKLDYHYVTLRNVQRSDVIVNLASIHHLDFSTQPPTEVAGGIRGELDFSRIRCEPPNKTCDVSFGLGGLSVPGSLTGMNFDLLLGGTIMTTIELGGSEDIPLPAGMVLCLNQTCFKRYFAATGVPGNRVAWGIGGKLDLADLIDKLGPVISGGGDVDIGPLIAGLLPLFSRFYTAMIPNVEVVPIPMVPDLNDIDGDPETDLVPDYDSFPIVDMTLTVKMNETMTFNTPKLQVGVYDGVIVIAGAIVRSAGFVPLGISAGLDCISAEDTPDGIIDDPIALNISDVAGRIPEDQVQRVVIALALSLDSLNQEGPMYTAGQIRFVEGFSGSHALPAFMPPAEATYDPLTRRLATTNIPAGADYYQASFSDERNASWHILTDDLTTFTLPPPPPEGDRCSRATITSIDLADGVSYQELLEFNDTNLGDLVRMVQAFSFTEIP